MDHTKYIEVYTFSIPYKTPFDAISNGRFIARAIVVRLQNKNGFPSIIICCLGNYKTASYR